MDIANALPVLHADMKLGLPSFVKAASWPSANEVNQLPATAFADGNRRFPIFSKAATFCSTLVASADGCDERTLGKITEACMVYGIAEEVLKYTGLFDTVKRASSPLGETHALVIDNAREFGMDQDKLFMLPITTPTEIEDSISELDKSAAEGRLPCEFIREAAVNLVKAAAEHDVSLPTGSVVNRLGHMRLPDYEKAAFLVENRVSVVPREAMDEYREIVGFLKTAGMEQNVIEGLRDLDANYGVGYGFGSLRTQPSPWEIVYSGPNDNDVVKMASTHVLISDCPVPMEALLSVSDKAIDQRFRKESAEQLKQAKAASSDEASRLIAGLSETQQIDLLDLVLADR